MYLILKYITIRNSHFNSSVLGNNDWYLLFINDISPKKHTSKAMSQLDYLLASELYADRMSGQH